MPRHPKTISLSSFKGLNNVLRPERTPQDYLKLVENVDIDKTGGIHKRSGYLQTLSGDVHSLWSDGNRAFCILDNNLVELDRSLSTTTILDTDYTKKVSFDVVDNKYYFTSETKNGTINGNSVEPWGLVRPDHNGSLSYSNTGILTEGSYQVALTFVDKYGKESGANVASLIQVPDNSSIQITNLPIPIDNTVTKYRVYCSTPNGEELYLFNDFDISVTSITISDFTRGVVPLQSFNKYHAPNGHIVKYAHGRLWVAEEDTLWYSDPMTYEWFDYQSNYFSFSSRIKAVLPTTGGLWICSDGLYYLSGKNPEKAYLELKEPVNFVEGTEVKVPGAYIFIENTPIGYKWLGTTDKGIYVFFNDGIALNMTEKNISFPGANKGTGIFVQKDGINRYTSILEKKKEPGNMAVGDQVTTKIIRNGIILED